MRLGQIGAGQAKTERRLGPGDEVLKQSGALRPPDASQQRRDRSRSRTRSGAVDTEGLDLWVPPGTTPANERPPRIPPLQARLPLPARRRPAAGDREAVGGLRGGAGQADAARGDDPSSRIRAGSGNVMGNCGHFGFCGALAPVACYTCNSFQAWVHGPHQEVLDGLLADNERVSRLTGDPQMTNIMNRTILAITRVIQLCNERKRELGML